jgi:acyl carrier protein
LIDPNFHGYEIDMAANDEILNVIANALQLPATSPIELDTRIADIPGWDSFGWIEVISSLESHFNRELPFDRIDDVRTVGDILTMIDSAK